MKKSRDILLVLLLAAVTINVLWQTVEPLVPYIISGLAVVLVVGFLYYRKSRW